MADLMADLVVVERFPWSKEDAELLKNIPAQGNYTYKSNPLYCKSLLYYV